MKNNKGQSLIDVVFSIGIITLVLTGVIVLIVSTAKIKRISLERQRAVQLSQVLIEKETLYIKNNRQTFWDGEKSSVINQSDSAFPDYKYDMVPDSCTDTDCKIIFTINWGVGQSLSVEKLFSRSGI